MRIRLFPKDPAFFDLFNSSADNAVDGAKLYLVVPGTGIVAHDFAPE